MVPFFNTDKLETYSPVMYEKVHLDLKKLEAWADTNEVFELSEFMSELTVDTVTGEYAMLRSVKRKDRNRCVPLARK